MRNHLGLALMNQQNNLRDLASSDARMDYQKATLGLQGAKFQNEMDRQRRFEDPVLQLNADKASSMNEDLTIDHFKSGLEHRNKLLEQGGGYDAIASIFGAKYDPSSRKLFRDGKPIKRFEAEDPNKMSNVKRVRWGFISPTQDITFNRAMLDDKLADGKPLTPEEDGFYQKTANMGPEQMANLLKGDLRNMQATYAKMAQDPDVPDGAKEAFLYQIQNQTQELQGIQSQLAEASKRQFELQKIDRRKTADGPQGPGFYEKEDYKYYMDQLDGINDARRKGGTEDEFGNFTPFAPDQIAELDRQEKMIRESMSAVRGGAPQDNLGLGGNDVQGRTQVQPDGSILTDTLPAQPDENDELIINGKRYFVQPVDKDGNPIKQPQPGEAQAAPSPVAPVQPVQPALSPQQRNQGEKRATRGTERRGLTIEEYMAQNPEISNQPGIMNLLDLDIPDEEKIRRIDRKMKRDRHAFSRKPPMVN